jgi:hypothetical protein
MRVAVEKGAERARERAFDVIRHLGRRWRALDLGQTLQQSYTVFTTSSKH